MSKKIDRTGQRYGRLVVVYEYGKSRHGAILWLCQCDCGKTIIVNGNELRDGDTKSCGCFRVENSRKVNLTHGMSGTRIYKIWESMKRRCYNEHDANYSCYGGRGIRICAEWGKDFTTFYTWAMNNGYLDTLTIDRIDVNGNYEPSNCRWATVKEQATNRRRTRLFSINGDTLSLSDWAKICGYSETTIARRLQKGLTIEQALGLCL